MRRRQRGERLLVCCNASGWVDLHSDDLNARFKELAGSDYTVKDLRTWHGTVLAATAFAAADPAVSRWVAKRVEAAVMREVAEKRDNTPGGGPRVPCGSTRRHWI
jgi:DNA topoisomerase I